VTKRGGYRRRWIAAGDAAVWCPGGRWGPRRVRVTECYAVLKAEILYTELLKGDAERLAPGLAGTATYTVEGRSHAARLVVLVLEFSRLGAGAGKSLRPSGARNPDYRTSSGIAEAEDTERRGGTVRDGARSADG